MEQTSPENVIHRDAAELAAGYSSSFRYVEIAAILGFFAISYAMAARILHAQPETWVLIAALIFGWVGADFVSGFVHWAADTWGTPEWPIVGQALIRPFREHHVDPKSITRHDFVEVNGANCLVSIPVLATGYLIPLGTPLGNFACAGLLSMILWVFGTNQFHKWAHTDAGALPAPVKFAQSCRLILSETNHEIHHSAPYDRYYCITTGLLNGFLHGVGFYRGAEWLITKTTGALPREDDIGKQAAEKISPVLKSRS